jgi:hypothetical protein
MKRIEPDLTEAEASKKIDRLQAKTGRGHTSPRARTGAGRRKGREAHR